MSRLTETIKCVLILVITMLLVAVAFALPIMILWNWLMPAIFGLTKIEFFKAFGIALLSRLLFGKNYTHEEED